MTPTITTRIAAVIPARDEELAIGSVVAGLRNLRSDNGEALIDSIVVCDNGSRDQTADMALRAGAKVVHQPVAGYGLACLTAIGQLHDEDILLFVDGDNAFRAEQALPLIAAINCGADLAIGSRVLGKMEPGALTFPQRFGNRLASLLIRIIWGAQVTDLGPFRAIRWESYRRLHMADRGFGWTVEMQVKAIQQGIKLVEVPVDTYRRIGRSKISGTLKGTVGAAHGILSMIARLWWQDRRQPRLGEDISPLTPMGDTER
ncbi:MAG: glycosyltransferase family 2 protein [Porticoccaceae bacterium]